MSEAIHVTALRMLARRGLFTSELAERLQRRGFTPDEIERELDRLSVLGLLDDVELAAALCRWELSRGKGRRSLAATMRRRGASEEVAARALAAVAEAEEEAALVMALGKAGRRHPGFTRLPQTRAKVVRYLLARGFGAANIYRALAAHGGDDSDAREDVEPGDTPELS